MSKRSILVYVAKGLLTTDALSIRSRDNAHPACVFRNGILICSIKVGVEPSIYTLQLRTRYMPKR